MNNEIKMPSIPNNQQFRKNWISEGIILSLTPVVAYLLSFTYERGFCDVFGIPFELISINFTTIFLVTSALISVSFLLFVVIDWIYIILPKNRRSNIFPRITLLVIMVFICSLSYGIGWLLFFTLSIIILFEFILPLIIHRKHKDYQSKLDAQDKLDKEADTLFNIIIQRINPRWILLLLAIFIMSVISESLGRYKAVKQEKFFVINTSMGPAVVLRIYNEKFICAPFIKETKELQGSFFIINMPTQSELVLTKENIGPFKIKKQ